MATASSPKMCDERRLPLGALLLAGSLSAMAQESPGESTRALKPLEVHTQAEPVLGKDALRAATTTIGKGNQALRDIPQSITVVTEKLIDDRHLDTVKEVLRNTAGVTFQAAEGGEEDIRLRGFSLATTGDLFIDGMRDPAFYDRDTFNNDRVELLRGSASMLFGRGSTGGAVNQVSKAPRLINEHEVTTTVGSHNYRRLTGDFNIKTGDSAALRLNAMVTTADNNGSGSSINKRGVAAAYSVGIGEKDEFTASLYSLDNQNGINYGLPWIRPNAAASTAQNTILSGLDPSAYYGLASDRNTGSAQWLALKHVHRFDHDNELQTQVRQGRSTRDQRASTVRFAGQPPGSAAAPLTNPLPVTLANLNLNTVLNRNTALKIQDVETTHLQSDYSNKFEALGVQHAFLGGVDFAVEKKAVSVARSAAQGGIDLVKPQATYGNANTGVGVAEDSRVLRPGNDYQATGYGIYAQDLVQVATNWKLLLGLRFDNLRGNYSTYTLPANAAAPVTTTSYSQDISAISKRLGVLYQPDPLHSYHFSYGTSFNTSGDVYSYNALSANTPPEGSENIEIGARIDSANKLFTTRFAVFQSTKTNERNTDPDTAATRLLLSGKRHASGLEVDVTGRINRAWEVYLSFMWLPEAVVDVAASTANTVGNRAGDRPGLSPVHSGTVWSTYQVNPRLRVGGGVNFRSAQSPADTTAPSWEAPGFATVDLMAEYAINDRWTMKANLNNAGNVLYADSLYRGHYVPGAGRVWLLSLNAKF
jgi:catecholate siderophore receptor